MIICQILPLKEARREVKLYISSMESYPNFKLDTSKTILCFQGQDQASREQGP